jgi:hypothetical protein
VGWGGVGWGGVGWGGVGWGGVGWGRRSLGISADARPYTSSMGVHWGMGLCGRELELCDLEFAKATAAGLDVESIVFDASASWGRTQETANGYGLKRGRCESRWGLPPLLHPPPQGAKQTLAAHFLRLRRVLGGAGGAGAPLLAHRPRLTVPVSGLSEDCREA